MLRNKAARHWGDAENTAGYAVVARSAEADRGMAGCSWWLMVSDVPCLRIAGIRNGIRSVRPMPFCHLPASAAEQRADLMNILAIAVGVAHKINYAIWKKKKKTGPSLPILKPY